MIIYNTTDFEQFEKRFRIQFFNSLSGFKSVNLVGTQNLKGQLNLTVFSSIFHMGSNPPYFGMLVRPAGDTPRHTLSNIIETKHYTLNHIHKSIYKQAHQTSAKYPFGTSEFDEVGLTPWHSNTVNAPYVLESNIKIGLECIETHSMSFNDTVLVVGKIIEVAMNDNYALPDGFIDLIKSGTLTSSGLDMYAEAHKVGRLSYAKPGTAIAEI